MEEFVKQIIGYTALGWVVYSWFMVLVNYLRQHTNIDITKLGCPKCFVFWLVLILTLDPYISSVASLINYLIDKYITSEKIRL